MDNAYVGIVGVEDQPRAKSPKKGSNLPPGAYAGTPQGIAVLARLSDTNVDTRGEFWPQKPSQAIQAIALVEAITRSEGESGYLVSSRPENEAQYRIMI